MRVSVASTGGGTGSASTGRAARRSVRYSSTGSTTQPPVVELLFCAVPVAATERTESVRQRALIAIAVPFGIAATIAVVERVRNAAGRFDPAKRDVNIPSRFIAFLL